MKSKALAPRPRPKKPDPPPVAERSPRPGRAVVVERNPSPPESTVDERDRVFLGYGSGRIDFLLTTGEPFHEAIEVGCHLGPDNREITVDDVVAYVVAYVLSFFHARRSGDPQDFALWNGDRAAPRLAAVLRGLPSGRRAVYFFGESGVTRRVYPPHEEWSKSKTEAGR